MEHISYISADGKKMVRVSKVTARKLYNEGKAFVIAPSGLFPAGVWYTGMNVNLFSDMREYQTFDEMVNSFENYNCSYETGYYASYYAPEAA